MKISEAWLREWVDPEKSSSQLVEQLTMAGLEVDAVEALGDLFSGVVVGEILTVEPHPEAEKLSICQLAGGKEEKTQVVCGAKNARPGLKVPFALLGATLPPAAEGEKKWVIKKAKLRGVESFGMLCGQVELQTGDDDSGLWELPADAPTGADLIEYLNLSDTIIDVDLTPNRSDCLSIKGLAREVAALNALSFELPATPAVPVEHDHVLSVSLQASKACPKYLGRVISGVDLSRSSPLWLQERLRRSGIKPIDPAVDATNYVMLELGQPMHAFDLDKIEQGIVVRMAKAGEKLTLLNQQELELKADTLVIADLEKPLAVAGIMGGASSAVNTESTKNLFLEAAFFDPIAIAGRARSYGLHTDSSHRFERGVDYQSTLDALERASQLILDIAGGAAGPVTHANASEHLPQLKTVLLRRAKIESGLGFAIPNHEVKQILTGLGLQILLDDEQGWHLRVPSYRFDIGIEADILEELARVYGYNRLPSSDLRFKLSLPKCSESLITLDRLKQQLVDRSYSEVITYSFIEPEKAKRFEPRLEPISMRNPISADMSVMRNSLLPGLVNTLLYNINRQQSRAKICESGLRFVSESDGYRQIESLAGVIYGSVQSKTWHQDGQRAFDFFDIKGDVEALLSHAPQPLVFERLADHPAFHPSQAAQLRLGERSIGRLGALHPEVLKAFGITQNVYAFELDLDGVLQAKTPVFKAVSKFPGVSRDLSMLVEQSLSVAELEACIRRAAGDNLKDLRLFDLYCGKGIDQERKSVAFSLTFQHPSRTLSEEEVNTPMDCIFSRLKSDFDVELR